MGLLTYDKGWQRGSFHPGKCVAAAILTLFPSCLGVCTWGNNYEYSNGTRAGVINKFSEKGVIWKTYEGQMALEGIVSTGDSVGANVWEFSLDAQRRQGENTEDLAKKIQENLEAGKKVRITYTQPLTSWPWRGSTSYFVQSVEPVEKKANKTKEE